MLRLSVLDRQISDARAAKLKAEKLLANLDAPRIAYEAAVKAEAELLTARQQAEQEAAQLAAERADLARDITLFDTLLRDKDAGLRFLQHLVAICESGRLGPPYQAAKVHALALGAAEHAATLRTKLADIDKRLKELDQ